ncbi:MAG: Rqc2 family fibronectin-binding protein [Fimbriimonadaceae bacterium]
MKIPYDATVLRSVLAELSPFVGGKVQRVVQPEPTTVCLELYGGPARGVASLLISCHAESYRMHFVTRRRPNPSEAPAFCMSLRARLEGQHLEGVEQVQGDRIARLTFVNGHALVVELMGKHSNIMLLDEHRRTVAAAKWVARAKSIRPIQPGQPYVLPPVMAHAEALSPFAQKLVAAGGSVDGPFNPILSAGNGAYPYSVAALALAEAAKPTISIALEQHYDAAIPEAVASALRASLSNDLKRVLLAREVAVADLAAAVRNGLRAGELQRAGELLLAYGPGQTWPRSSLAAFDYDGAPITIPTDPELDFKANAERFFTRARRAKDRLEFAQGQLSRLTLERDAIAGVLRDVEAVESLNELQRLHDQASAKRWLHVQHHADKLKDRPFEGHRVREVTGPGGCRVLFGENAEANDYLTLRVAKPNDIWLHVRGGTSAHVVIATNNQPDRVGPEALMFAAQVAVKNSVSKHAGIVAVDYTLKKHVRKSKGAPAGSAFYTHEKTLHVESGRT